MRVCECVGFPLTVPHQPPPGPSLHDFATRSVHGFHAAGQWEPSRLTGKNGFSLAPSLHSLLTSVLYFCCNETKQGRGYPHKRETGKHGRRAVQKTDEKNNHSYMVFARCYLTIYPCILSKNLNLRSVSGGGAPSEKHMCLGLLPLKQLQSHLYLWSWLRIYKDSISVPWSKNMIPD